MKSQHRKPSSSYYDRSMAHASEIKAVVAADKTGNVTYGDTTGFLDFSTDLNDGIHPWGSVHVGVLAPRLVKLIVPLLLSS